jgi:hypothetical protein
MVLAINSFFCTSDEWVRFHFWGGDIYRPYPITPSERMIVTVKDRRDQQISLVPFLSLLSRLALPDDGSCKHLRNISKFLETAWRRAQKTVILLQCTGALWHCLDSETLMCMCSEKEKCGRHWCVNGCTHFVSLFLILVQYSFHYFDPNLVPLITLASVFPTTFITLTYSTVTLFWASPDMFN